MLLQQCMRCWGIAGKVDRRESLEGSHRLRGLKGHKHWRDRLQRTQGIRSLEWQSFTAKKHRQRHPWGRHYCLQTDIVPQVKFRYPNS